MNDFITWATLETYATFVTMTYMVVEVTKELPYIIKIHTKYYSAIVAFLLMLAMVLHDGSFTYWDIVLYALTAISVSLGANGLSDFTGGKHE
jgi:hypothetical protein